MFYQQFVYLNNVLCDVFVLQNDEEQGGAMLTEQEVVWLLLSMASAFQLGL